MSRRIIISVTNDLSIDQRLNRVARTLVEAGWDVLVVGRLRKDSLALPALPYETRRMRLLTDRGKLFYLEFNLRLLLFLLFRPAHTLYANDLDALFPNWAVARLRRKRLVYDSHEYFTEMPELVTRPRIRRLWLRLERFLFPRVDVALTVNEGIAEAYTRIYGLPVHAIRNLPFRVPPPPERHEAGRLLLYQGALNMGRGIELMMAALAHLPAEYRLVVAGRGPWEGELKAEAKRLGLGERVLFRGHVPFAELPALTRTAALGMSLEEDLGMSYRLALPNKLFDYLQSGIPVLVSDLPEMADVVRAYGVGELLPQEERNGAALAARIRAMCEDGGRWGACRAAALAAAEELCWERERGKLLALLP